MSELCHMTPETLVEHRHLATQSNDEGETRGTRKRRMEMDVVNAVERLARQSRRVVVVDVAGRARPRM